MFDVMCTDKQNILCIRKTLMKRVISFSSLILGLIIMLWSSTPVCQALPDCSTRSRDCSKSCRWWNSEEIKQVTSDSNAGGCGQYTLIVLSGTCGNVYKYKNPLSGCPTLTSTHGVQTSSNCNPIDPNP